MQSEEARIEVKRFEENAREGVRFVLLITFLRRFAKPLLSFFALCIFGAFTVNGIWAGLVSLLVFSGPILVIVVFSFDQSKKVMEFWKS
jgi:hypothetical protein